MDNTPIQGSETEISKYSPSKFMRERHPDLFSDSVPSLEYEVSRELLSYHLETLTNQKGETSFEFFAQRLCEKFISPNLRPQTGPVGGGDGKTDAETYPVSEEISDRWFVPQNSRAGERRAFAFSAKKDWRSKVKSDVAAIAGTERDYNHIYFVTNQFVPAKKTAELQDSLLKKHGIPVTILDRTWLLDRVLNHDSMDIAVDELGVGKGTEKAAKNLGPSDAARKAEMEALEASISNGANYQGQPVALVEGTRHVALLARGLEYPIEEVNGLFERARRLARKHNFKKLELVITYEWAWTAHFWHEDHELTSDLYDDVAELALGSGDADDLECLSNLLPLVRMSVRTGLLDVKRANLDERTSVLKDALSALSLQTHRPNNALHCEALLLLTRVSEKGVEHRNDPLADIWIQFADVINRADGLATFPFTSIAEALIQIGEFIADSEEFDILFENVTNALATRISESEAAKRSVQRGHQKLTRGLPLDAIRWFGRAVALLLKEENEDDLVDALLGAGVAFEEVGLPWASRNYTLAALSIQFRGFTSSGLLRFVQPMTLSRYFDVEFRLGRLPQILSAYELEMMVLALLARNDAQTRRVEQIHQAHMMKIASLLLHLPPDTLDAIAKLPDSLQRISLPMARSALLYLMGHEKTLREEGVIPSEETSEAVDDFMREVYHFGEVACDSSEFELGTGATVALSSVVLGCKVTLECDNNLVSIGIGEAILGSLEALLATSLDHKILPIVDHLQIRVEVFEECGMTPVIEFYDLDGDPTGKITHRAAMEYENRDDLLSFPAWLNEAVFNIFIQFAAPQDIEGWAKALFEEERALDRAFSFSQIPMMLAHIHGENADLSLSPWINSDDLAYAVERIDPLYTHPDSSASQRFSDIEKGDDLASEDMRRSARSKHSSTRWISPINTKTWDKAKWSATLFMWSPDDDAPPPVLGIAFANIAKGRDIFKSWRKRYGDDDTTDDLNITIVRGISKNNPAAYAVKISQNPDNIRFEKDDYVGLVSRINRMFPQTTQNLDGFLNQFQNCGRYLLIPAHLPTLTSTPKPLLDLAIGKHKIDVMEAWEIGPNSLESVVLDLDELPLIPEDQPDAPVIETLEWLRKLRR